MISGGYLKGTCVRDRNGGRGRLIAVEDNHVLIGWDVPDTVALREEKLDRAAERYRYGIEILTLDRGWVSLTAVLPTTYVDVVSEVRMILDEDEAHDPFKNKARLGPGPRGQTLTKKKKWACSGSGYEQVCVGIDDSNRGRTIVIKIDPEYKAQYNKEYRRFRRNRKRQQNRRRSR